MKIILACEYGFGRRHAVRMSVLCQELLEYGHTVCVYHHRTSDFHFFNLNDPVQITAYPLSPQQFHTKDEVGILNFLRLIIHKDFHVYCKKWLDIISYERPDLIICDNAPILGMLIGGTHQVVHIGDGSSMLPFVKNHFPWIHQRQLNLNHLDTVNTCLQTFQLPPLERLGQVWHPQHCYITYHPHLDIYRQQRTHEIYVQNQVRHPNTGIGDRDLVFAFCYLNSRVPYFDAILLALVQHSIPGIALIEQISDKHRQFLQQNGFKVVSTLQELIAEPERMRVNSYIHHGGLTLCNQAYNQFIPQIIFPGSTHGLLISNFLHSNDHALIFKNPMISAHDMGMMIEHHLNRLQHRLSHTYLFSDAHQNLMHHLQKYLKP